MKEQFSTSTSIHSCDYHCHLVALTGTFAERIAWEEQEFRRRKIAGVTVTSLRRDAIGEFCESMQAFHARPRRGPLLGRAIEGPGLEHPGGVPLESAWAPSESEWRRILGSYPSYVVVSDPSESLVSLFDEFGVTLAIGHITNSDEAAERIGSACEAALSRDLDVLADHFLNDCRLPKAFAYCRRKGAIDEIEASAQRLEQASLSSCHEVLGPTPAVLLRLAAQGAIRLLLQVDGHHVDHRMIRALFNLLPAGRFSAMTDLLYEDSDGHGMLGNTSNPYRDGLYWSSNGEVAGGACDLNEGRARMEHSGLFATAELDAFFAYRPFGSLRAYDPV
jgi:hypothetical protein